MYDIENIGRAKKLIKLGVSRENTKYILSECSGLFAKLIGTNYLVDTIIKSAQKENTDGKELEKTIICVLEDRIIELIKNSDDFNYETY